MYKKISVMLVFAIGAMLSIFRAGAQASSSSEEGFPAHFDVVAKVRVQTMEHTLRASDIRRVDHGAPAPLVPYKTRLTVVRTYPRVQLYRVLLDGITTSTWMPEQDDVGIIVLQRLGQEYQPAASFPGQSFLLEQVVDGERRVEFPTQSGCIVSYDRVWECLGELLDAKNGGVTEDKNSKWGGILVEGPLQEMPTALFFLLNAPGATAPWEPLLTRLTVADGIDAQSLPREGIVQLLGAYASGEKAPGAVDLLLKMLPMQSGNTPMLADAALRAAMRAPLELRARILEDIFSHEVETRKGREALFGAFDQIKPALANLVNDSDGPLLLKMLHEPARFPALRQADALEDFWRLLGRRRLEGFSLYLEAFVKTPTAEMLGLELDAAALDHLDAVARTLLAEEKAFVAP